MNDQQPPDASAMDDGHPSLEELSSLLDGELEAGRDEAVREHAQACASCSTSLASMSEAVSALRAAACKATVPQGAAAAAIARALHSLEPDRPPARVIGTGPASDDARAAVTPPRTRRHRFRVAGVAAALALLGGLASGLGYLASHSGSSASSGAAAEHVSSARTTIPPTGSTSFGPGRATGGPSATGVQLQLLAGAGSCASGSLPPGAAAETNLSAARLGPCLFVRPLDVFVSPLEVTSLAVSGGPEHTFIATIRLASQGAVNSLGARREVVAFGGGAQGVVTGAGGRSLRLAELTSFGVHRLEQLLGEG
ncbi:MAG: zf-HC2 domain-containing protein [Actinomycetota bacterium]|nr:zf-HC2 domain-containing protein [Actinomycetota bacterium]